MGVGLGCNVAEVLGVGVGGRVAEAGGVGRLVTVLVRSRRIMVITDQ